MDEVAVLNGLDGAHQSKTLLINRDKTSSPPKSSNKNSFPISTTASQNDLQSRNGSHISQEGGGRHPSESSQSTKLPPIQDLLDRADEAGNANSFPSRSELSTGHSAQFKSCKQPLPSLATSVYHQANQEAYFFQVQGYGHPKFIDPQILQPVQASWSGEFERSQNLHVQSSCTPTSTTMQSLIDSKLPTSSTAASGNYRQMTMIEAERGPGQVSARINKAKDQSDSRPKNAKAAEISRDRQRGKDWIRPRRINQLEAELDVRTRERDYYHSMFNQTAVYLRDTTSERDQLRSIVNQLSSMRLRN